MQDRLTTNIQDRLTTNIQGESYGATDTESNSASSSPLLEGTAAVASSDPEISTAQGQPITALKTILSLQKITRKDCLKLANLVKEAYSMVGAGLVLFSCSTEGGVNASLGLIVSLFLGAVWNLTNIVSIALSLPDFINDAHEEPSKKNLFLLVSHVIGLVGLLVGTIWGTVSTIQSAEKAGVWNVWKESSITLGNPLALAFGIDGGFLLGQLVDTAKGLLTPIDSNQTSCRKVTAVSGDATSAAGAFFAMLSMLNLPKALTYFSGAFYTVSAVLKMTLLIPAILGSCQNASNKKNDAAGLFNSRAASSLTVSSSIQGIGPSPLNRDGVSTRVLTIR